MYQPIDHGMFMVTTCLSSIIHRNHNRIGRKNPTRYVIILLGNCLQIREILTAHMDTNKNVADIATKIVPGGQKREYLVAKLL